MIEQLAGFPDDVLAFVRQGHVTKDDYDTVLVPAVTKALETQKRLRGVIAR
jgi:predicted metal-dependent peptidase